MDIIKKMEEARLSHLDWARHQEHRKRKGLPLIDHVGGPTCHRNWVKIYDAVIEALNNGSHPRR